MTTNNLARIKETKRPLIVVTNDDGIESAGLWAAAEAVLAFGDVLVVAPDRQWSGAGRSMPHTVNGAYTKTVRQLSGRAVRAYSVDASPALAVEHAVLEFADRPPSLVISGINFGANASVDITISGTVGAALEGSAFGIPSLAVSLEMDSKFYLTGDSTASYQAAQAYINRFARTVLRYGLPHGIDILNINIPSGATAETPWRRTHLSRFRYFTPIRPDRLTAKGRPGYRIIDNPEETEPNSDLYVLLVEQMVSVTPVSLDMSAPVIDYMFSEALTGELMSYEAIPTPGFGLPQKQVPADSTVLVD